MTLCATQQTRSGTAQLPERSATSSFRAANKAASRRRHKSVAVAAILGCFCISTVYAETTGVPAPFKPSGVVEAGINSHYVSNGFGNWFGQYLKGEYQSDEKNRWFGEVRNQKEFRDSAMYGAIGNTHIFNEDWFSTISAGSGNGALFYPNYRVDAFINRKLLQDRNLIATFGAGVYKAPDIHKDKSLFFGLTYYFKSPWIVQAGIRYNYSNPGRVNSNSQFIAVTQGHDKDYFITARFGFGEEAYQLVGPASTLNNFRSQEGSLELKKWLGEDIGFTVKGEHYHNPTYNRTGITAGVFKEF